MPGKVHGRYFRSPPPKDYCVRLVCGHTVWAENEPLRNSKWRCPETEPCGYNLRWSEWWHKDPERPFRNKAL